MGKLNKGKGKAKAKGNGNANGKSNTLNGVTRTGPPAGKSTPSAPASVAESAPRSVAPTAPTSRPKKKKAWTKADWIRKIKAARRKKNAADRKALNRLPLGSDSRRVADATNAVVIPQ